MKCDSTKSQCIFIVKPCKLQVLVSILGLNVLFLLLNEKLISNSARSTLIFAHDTVDISTILFTTHILSNFIHSGQFGEFYT